MEIGQWKATAELGDVYRKARDLGLETNLAELEAFGFTIIEPEKAAPPGFTDRMLEAVLALEARESPDVVDMMNRPQSERPVYGRSLFRIPAKDPVFAEAAVSPVALTLAKYLTGASNHIYNSAALLKRGKAGTTRMHCDSVGFSSPLPPYGATCNTSWILTDYTEEKGTFFIVPGSHRYCRQPGPMDLPRMMGGPNENDSGIPVIAKAGSLFVFSGNLWHGTYPKEDEDLRVHCAIMYSRNYVYPGESFSDVPDDYIARFGPEFARLMGRKAWQGYGDEGPNVMMLAGVQRAHVTPSA
ncbi:MAG TPA: phytanoyl-CoA dioxygenase family protein [Caulobacter sp.]|nr:phytanoyl-CoA dioxygenase family protein [Caulobacter sp.]